MSKFVKNLIVEEVRKRLSGIGDCLLVNVVGLKSLQVQNVRKQLRAKGIDLLVVKNSLARRATEGTPLASAFQDSEGALAVLWGGEDIVALAKEAVRLHDDTKAAPKFQSRGGVLDGEKISVDRVKEVSKWPGRKEQLALLVGQILGPGAQLVAQIKGPAGQLAAQVKTKTEGEEKGAEEAAPAAPEASSAPETPAVS